MRILGIFFSHLHQVSPKGASLGCRVRRGLLSRTRSGGVANSLPKLIQDTTKNKNKRGGEHVGEAKGWETEGNHRETEGNCRETERKLGRPPFCSLQRTQYYWEICYVRAERSVPYYIRRGEVGYLGAGWEGGWGWGELTKDCRHSSAKPGF